MTATIDATVCKGCLLCLEVCPHKTLSQGTAHTPKGYTPPLVDAERCTRCGQCAVLCPEMAISVEKGGASHA